MGFSLGIKNAPSGAVYWWGELTIEELWSGWLSISSKWNCSYNPYSAIDLKIQVVNSVYGLLHQKTNLGPVYDGKSYIYDCTTGVLSEEIPVYVGWLQVASSSLSIPRLVTYVGWLQVASSSLSIPRLVTYVGWLQVAMGSLAIPRLVTYAGWLNVASGSVAINRPTPTPPPLNGGTSLWWLAALGAAGVGAALLAKGKKK